MTKVLLIVRTNSWGEVLERSKVGKREASAVNKDEVSIQQLFIKPDRSSDIKSEMKLSQNRKSHYHNLLYCTYIVV